MPVHRIGRTCPREDGFALIEVVVSALIAAIVVGGVITLLSATGKAAAQQRIRAQAYAVAQEDQARLRGTRISALNRETETRPVVVNGMTFTVTSNARFISDKTGATTCSGGSTSADYVRIGTSVTWASMRAGAKPVLLESIVSPVSGSLDPTSGGVAIRVVNGTEPTPSPISGVGLNGTGTSTFSGSTDSNGCAVFGGLPGGNYTLTPTLAAEYINANGEAPKPTTITVSSGSVLPVNLIYDRKGTVNLSFSVRNSAGTVVTAKGDTVVATATGMTSGARTFGTPKTYATSIAATPLFPFGYTYAFFGGACAANAGEAAGTTNVKAPAGGSASGTIQLPALYVSVKNGTTSLTGAKVTITDTKCAPGGTEIKREYTTTGGTIEKTTSGYLENVGFPASTYAICASATIGSEIRRIKQTVEVKSVNGTAAAFDLSTGYEKGAAC
jgi:type II secretory pathway pseudopilin PulG